MAKLGTDWVFIGVGIGAIYLVYQLTNRVTTVLDNTGEGLKSLGKSLSNFSIFGPNKPDAVNLVAPVDTKTNKVVDTIFAKDYSTKNGAFSSTSTGGQQYSTPKNDLYSKSSFTSTTSYVTNPTAYINNLVKQSNPTTLPTSSINSGLKGTIFDKGVQVTTQAPIPAAVPNNSYNILSMVNSRGLKI